VLRDASSLPRTSLIALALLASATIVFAADSSSASADNTGDYKTVPVNINGKEVAVRVANNNPYAHVQSRTTNDGKYHPENFSFNTTSSMGNKAFALPTSSLAHGDSEFTDPGRNAYATKPYSDTSAAPSAGPDTKSRFTTFAANTSRPASGYDRNYATASADSTLNRQAELPPSNTTVDQNRAALFTPQDKDLGLTPNAMANKTYLGPGAPNNPDDKDNPPLTRMSEVPDRPLSIDEVRNLINHSAKPDTTAKPEQPSKALNDPGYKPEPLRDDPSPTSSDRATAPHPGKFDLVPVSSTPSDDDKNDPVPSPGTMAAPENTEPLPQR
jgi:hypothetical protein